MSTLPVSIEIDLNNDGIVIYAEERDAVFDVVQSVATSVSPALMGRITRAIEDYNESGGISAAASLDDACDDIPGHAVVQLLRLSAPEALSLGAALQRFALELLAGDVA